MMVERLKVEEKILERSVGDGKRLKVEKRWKENTLEHSICDARKMKKDDE